MRYRIITNNRKARNAFAGIHNLEMVFLEGEGYRDVLVEVRSLVQQGWHLITHPLASNLKPMQCPYKTVIVSESEYAGTFLEDEQMIERSIEAVDKLTGGRIELPDWPEKILSDYQTVDLAVVKSAMERSLLQQNISAGR